MAVIVTDVLQRIADAIKKDPSTLQAWWVNHANSALVYAQNEVKGKLIARGFTSSQIASWDRYDEFVSDIALFRALVLGGMLEGFDRTWVDCIDRRKELKAVQVFVNGAYINPAAGSDGPGQAVAAPITSGRCDVFNGPGTEFGGGDGRPTRW